jgi:cation diffusion facilitator family transporter
MNSPSESDFRARADREKSLVAFSSLAAALLLTALKIAVGLATNSLGILSEAAHSGLDLVAAGVTFWAVRISGRPADRDHTYGHGKFENLSALFETLLLLLTCVWIVYEAVSRLFFETKVVVDASIWAFLVITLSVVVDFSRSRALSRAAKKYKSQALEADALHFSTDIWSSCVVLAGLFGVLVAERFGLPWLEKADSVAALGVALIVIWISVELGKRSIDDLLDRVPTNLRDEVARVAANVPGVERVTQVRMRRSGPETFADVTLTVNRVKALEDAHDIASRAEDAVRSVLPQADVVVHVEPVAPSQEDMITSVRLLAARQGLGAHAVRIYQQDGQRSLELHIEVSEHLSLEEAHRQASQFEEAIRRQYPELGRIVTHIEPAGEAAATSRSQPANQATVRQVIREFLETERLGLAAHDIEVQQVDGELAVSFHCVLPPSLAITAAHDMTLRLEKYLRARVPNLGRVVIHVEPEERSQATDER